MTENQDLNEKERAIRSEVRDIIQNTVEPRMSEDGELHSGQARIAYRLAGAYGDALMHVHGLGWYCYDGARWVEDHGGAAKRAVLDVLRNALAESLGDADLRKDVRKCESAAGISGVLEIAAALEPFAFTVEDLDADPYLLNVANGTLDLRTRELRPHEPDDRCTKVARGAYRPGSSGPQWQAFLETVLPDDDVRRFVQRLAGVGLVGKVLEQVLPILTGTGANGKGVFYGAINNTLGDYATVGDPDLFMHRDGAHPTGEMDLLGLRWVVVSESDKDRRLAEATMKRLTGGDEIKARRMRQDFVSFIPSHTPLLVTNHLPKVSGDDPALWRRMRVVPFDVVIPKDQRDPHLPERLQLEADAVLTWAIDGYAAYEERGLDEPESVQVATDKYQLESDAIARFIAECCIPNPHMWTTTAEAFGQWQTWAALDGADALSQKAFGQALDRQGYPTSKSNGKKVRRGIGLAADDSEGDA